MKLRQKSMLLMFFMMLMSMNVMAQSSSYVSTLKEYLTLTQSSNLDTEKMKKTLQALNQSKYSQLTLAQSEKLIDEYLSSQYEADVYEKVLAPIFQKHASEEELKKQIAVLTTPEGKLYTEHLNAASAGVGLMLGISILTLLTDDDGSGDETPEEECSQSYRDLFNKYYDASRIEQMLSGVMNTLVSNMKDRVDDQKILEKLAKGMQHNLKKYSLTCFVEIMTEDDMKFGLKMFEDPAAKHIQDASLEMSGNIVQLALSSVSCYTEWLQAKGISAQ